MAKKPRTGLTVRLQLDGAKETLVAFRKLPKDASAELRDAAQKLSRDLADSARAAAVADESPQSPLLAPTVKPVRDRVPAMQAGGTKRLGRNRVPAWRLLFGSEFGSNTYGQFHKPHSGRKGTWFFDTVERDQSTINREWNKAADAVIRKFSGGGI